MVKISILSLERLCDEKRHVCHSEQVKNLMHSIRYTTQILRLTPQNDITVSDGRGKGD